MCYVNTQRSRYDNPPSYLCEYRQEGLVYFYAPEWDPDRISFHAFFGRHGGVSRAPYDSLNTSVSTGDDPECVKENIGRNARTLSRDVNQILTVRQVHSGTIVCLKQEDPVVDITTIRTIEADGLCTDRTDVVLSVRTADCLPIVCVDPVRPSVGIVHAGWRGTLKGVLTRCLEQMHRTFRSEPGRMRVLFGPGIGPCCFVVDQDVAERFLRKYNSHDTIVRPASNGKFTVDLYKANRASLLEAGIRSEHVVSEPLCTCCRKEMFFSARAHGVRTGRQMSVIGLNTI